MWLFLLIVKRTCKNFSGIPWIRGVCARSGAGSRGIISFGEAVSCHPCCVSDRCCWSCTPIGGPKIGRVISATLHASLQERRLRHKLVRLTHREVQQVRRESAHWLPERSKTSHKNMCSHFHYAIFLNTFLANFKSGTVRTIVAMSSFRS